MLRFVVVIVIVAAALPLLVEQTVSPCDALEKRMVAMAAHGKSDPALTALLGNVQNLTSGHLAEAAVKQKYPGVPSPLACYMVYYEAYYHGIVRG